MDIAIATNVIGEKTNLFVIKRKRRERWQTVSDYISKSAFVELTSDTYNSYGNNALCFDEEETKAIRRFCIMIQKRIEELPTLSETEIIRKAFERVVERLEEKAKERWLVLAERNGYERAICIVKEEGGIE